MKQGYIPKNERKTILFLADDLRLPSGIGTMTRELVLHNAHRYNFVHVAAAINHPDMGKIFDLSADINKEIGIEDSSVILYPNNGYGDPDLVRTLMSKHKIDAIVHFTDPRYWIWLYQMSAEVRQNIPIFYYHIWDDLPAPHYNKPYYESCDLLMGISKQSNNIAKLVLGADNYLDIDNELGFEGDIEVHRLPKVCYVPHGIDNKYFYPIDRQDAEVQQMRKSLFGDANPELVVLYNNRNIRRKMTSDVILAFKLFCDDLKTSGDNSDVRLVLKTQPVDENGTDLVAVIDTLCPELADNIQFDNARHDSKGMNLLYNACDVVINIASNEGWGLSSTEAMMTGRVLINNVTGGLQDQCRFEDENGNWIEFDEDFASNHTGRYRKHGEWVKPVFPAAINLQGSIATPYIFDDRCDIRDVAAAIKYWYKAGHQARTYCGDQGRKWAMSDEAGFTAEHMANRFSVAVDQTLNNWVAPKRFTLYNVAEEVVKIKNRKTGITL
jgi:glycosyltransferase involved in cell wall biosynthesis